MMARMKETLDKQAEDSEKQLEVIKEASKKES